MSRRLSTADLQTLYSLANEVQRYRRRFAVPIPDDLRRLAALLWDMIESGPEDEPTHGDEIGTKDAAKILGCSDRHIRAIATDLDGVRVGRRSWCFSRRAVEEYARARRAA